jgi:hypothetical protein
MISLVTALRSIGTLPGGSRAAPAGVERPGIETLGTAAKLLKVYFLAASR